MSHASRRELLASLAAAPLVPGLASAASAPSRPLLEEGDTVLFQGDSITDAGRSREHEGKANDPAALGNGYALLAAGGMHCARPASKLRFHNRGISGNKVFQLADRWQKDCLDLAPDVLSILIGVNDIWHKRGGHYDGTVEKYEGDYDALLTRTREALPEVKLVVCEPFVLRCGAVDDSWFPEFDTYRAAARRVADGHGAVFVPFHSMFEDALAIGPAKLWAGDGVHPSPAGAALMAQAWLRAVGA
jgi:lysophospholipase L1-like esterase